VIAADRAREPFLIFRDESRWLLVRYAPQQPRSIPRSATIRSIRIAETDAQLVSYAGGGFLLSWTRDGQTIIMSGNELSEDEMSRTAASMQPLTVDELEARLTQNAPQSAHTTLLWPTYLPDGFTIVPDATRIERDNTANAVNPTGYLISFRGSGSLLIGGGTMPPPALTGAQERIVEGSRIGVLTVDNNRYLLVVDTSSADTPPYFPADIQEPPNRLPLVQQGKVFVMAENIDRSEFDRVVAGLISMLNKEFVARSAGPNPYDLTYLWPGTSDHGYTIDLATTEVGWDEYLLQGGTPFFRLSATGSAGTATIKSGHERDGTHLLVPEGPGVQRLTGIIHGRTASVARTSSATDVVWSEGGVQYGLTSSTLSVDQLLGLGEALQPVDPDEFYRRLE
jgi:hypothetical protein